MEAVSVIGLGAMGSALAQALLAHGYDVTVWNRSSERMAPLVAAGARPAASATQAVTASPATITCVASHDQTIGLMSRIGEALKDRTIIELSTGGATEAEALARLLEENGARWMIGIINEYPTGIGKPGTVLSVVGASDLWDRWAPVFRALGGASNHVGTRAGMAAALFAALFTTRQGFMFGMIFGALVCKKAGIPLATFSEQVPVSLGVLPSYHAYFAGTVPEGRYDNPSATMKVYAAALDDALKTFDDLGAAAELPRLFSDLAHRGMEAGLDEQALTALVELMDRG